MSDKTYHIIGLMSGSSLDGLDIAYCSFTIDDTMEEGTTVPDGFIKNWQLIHSASFPFSEKWQLRLSELPQQSGLNFAKTNTYFGHYCSEMINTFIEQYQIDPDFISAHGHTIYHFPDKRISVQIGDGAAMAALTGYPVINNFRTQDIALDGEGAPIAPIADQLLFQGYDFFLNIGGIANITCNIDGKFIAFDIGPANQVLNLLAKQLGKPYDEDGLLARQAKSIPALAEQVNAIDYFQQSYPKTLDNNWIREVVFPMYLDAEGSWNDKLRTASDQLAQQTAMAIKQIIQKENFQKTKYNLLATGGGAFNRFVMEQIKDYCAEINSIEIIIPDPSIIEFKEAILMALMGLLRVENRPNCLKTVTGASRNNIGGSIFQGSKKFI